MSHSIIFSGSLATGISRDQAQASLATLFRIDDASRLDHYFSGAEHVIKTGLDQAQAEKYRQALTRAGLVVTLRDDAPPASAPAPADTPATAQWWVIPTAGERQGPFTRDQLTGMAQVGQLTHTDRLWKTGLKEPVAPASLSWVKMPPAPLAAAEPPAPPATPRLGQPADVAKPKAVWPVVLLGLLALAANAWLYAILTPHHGKSLAVALGGGIGASLPFPLVLMLIISAWRSMRTPATLSRVFFVACLTMVSYNFYQLLTTERDNSNHGDPDAPMTAVELMQVAKAASPFVPITLDENTQWLSASAESKTLVMKFLLIKHRASEIDSQRFGDVQGPLVQTRYCTDLKSRVLLRRGVVYRIEYYGSDYKKVWQMNVSPALCGIVPIT